MQTQRTRLWQVLLGIAFVSSLVLYLLFLATARMPFKDGTSAEPLPLTYNKSETLSKFYEWRTTTAFPSVERAMVTNATTTELCNLFPRHKMEKIQPVLKTGHGSLHRVHASLRSTSACLENLLIFSDLDEEIDGHQIIDIIADIPQYMLLEDAAINQTLPYREIHQRASNGTLDDTGMRKIKAWEIDKFKFLPGISRAWRMAPGNRWYVFYEGDTYIVWDTVFRLLENFDPDMPQYFGSPSPRMENEWFANGGPGYILSREAMRRLVQEDWDVETGEWWGNVSFHSFAAWAVLTKFPRLGSKLSERYWGAILGDCCGDSILGWILLEHGILLQGLWPMFNPHPLQGIPFSESHWCQPVLSMHKSEYEIEKEFWRWEWVARSVDPRRPTLYRDIAKTFFNFAAHDAQRDDWDNSDWDGFEPASDEDQNPHYSSTSCASACSMSESCFQWTYQFQRCTFVRSFRMGLAKTASLQEENEEKMWSSEDRRSLAGWDIAKIRQWMDERPCDEVQWVRPSTERVF